MENNYKVRLKLVRSDNPSVLDGIMIGETSQLPEIGKRFQLIGESGGVEDLVVTAQIEHLEKLNNEYRFQTKNSFYHLEILQ